MLKTHKPGRITQQDGVHLGEPLWKVRLDFYADFATSPPWGDDTTNAQVLWWGTSCLAV